MKGGNKERVSDMKEKKGKKDENGKKTLCK